MGLLDFKVDVVLARLEADFSDQPPNIPAGPNQKVSLQCPTAEYPCSAQPKYLCSAQAQSIPAVPRKVSLHCPTAKYPCSAQRKVSSQCPTAKYPCSAQLQSIPAVPNCRVSLQCPTTKYPCRAQPKSIPAVPNGRVSLQPNRRVSLECPTAEYQYSCSAFAVLQGRQLRGAGKTLHFLCNNGFRVGMLEVNNYKYHCLWTISRFVHGLHRLSSCVELEISSTNGGDKAARNWIRHASTCHFCMECPLDAGCSPTRMPNANLSFFLETGVRHPRNCCCLRAFQEECAVSAGILNLRVNLLGPIHLGHHQSCQLSWT